MTRHVIDGETILKRAGPLTDLHAHEIQLVAEHVVEMPLVEAV
jgi:hypothetical protein